MRAKRANDARGVHVRGARDIAERDALRGMFVDEVARQCKPRRRTDAVHRPRSDADHLQHESFDDHMRGIVIERQLFADAMRNRRDARPRQHRRRVEDPRRVAEPREMFARYVDDHTRCSTIAVMIRMRFAGRPHEHVKCVAFDRAARDVFHERAARRKHHRRNFVIVPRQRGRRRIAAFIQDEAPCFAPADSFAMRRRREIHQI